MNIKLRRQWESRLPYLDEMRTHWLLECDGGTLGVTDDLNEALNIIDQNHERCAQIYAYRALVGASGSVFKARGRRFVIWSRANA